MRPADHAGCRGRRRVWPGRLGRRPREARRVAHRDLDLRPGHAVLPDGRQDRGREDSEHGARRMNRAAAWLLRALLLAACGFMPLALAAPPPRLPVEAFGTRPSIEDPVLSPNGDMMAARLSVEGEPVLAIFNLVDRTQGTRMVKIGEHEIAWFDWAGPDRVLISLWMKATLEGYETHVTRLVTYEVSTGKATYVGYTTQGLDGDDVIYTAEDGSHILLSLARTAFSYPDVYRCDLATGKLTRVVDAREPIYYWYADEKGEVRIGM